MQRKVRLIVVTEVTHPRPGAGVPLGAVGVGAGQLRLGPGAQAQRLIDLRQESEVRIHFR